MMLNFSRNVSSPVFGPLRDWISRGFCTTSSKLLLCRPQRPQNTDTSSSRSPPQTAKRTTSFFVHLCFNNSPLAQQIQICHSCNAKPLHTTELLRLLAVLLYSTILCFLSSFLSANQTTSGRPSPPITCQPQRRRAARICFSFGKR